MRALITGAGGFVGHHLQRHLEQCGDEVIATDRVTDGLDILDAAALLEKFRRSDAEVVYHLAGASDVGGSWQAPQSTFRANAEGTLNVLWAAREADVQRVLTVGSADVYGKVTAESQLLLQKTNFQNEELYQIYLFLFQSFELRHFYKNIINHHLNQQLLQ